MQDIDRLEVEISRLTSQMEMLTKERDTALEITVRKQKEVASLITQISEIKLEYDRRGSMLDGMAYALSLMKAEVMTAQRMDVSRSIGNILGHAKG